MDIEGRCELDRTISTQAVPSRERRRSGHQADRHLDEAVLVVEIDLEIPDGGL